MSLGITVKKLLNVDSSSTCWSNLRIGYGKSFGSIDDCGYIS